MSNQDSWEARMATRARQRAGHREQPNPPLRVPDTCAACGVEGSPRLPFGNIKSGARYCSEDHLKRDPGWYDFDVWMA